MLIASIIKKTLLLLTSFLLITTAITQTDVVTGLNTPFGLAISGTDLYITESITNGFLKTFDLTTLSLNDLTLDSKKLHVIPNASTERITISGLKNKERFGIYNLLGAEMLIGALIDNDEIEIKRF